MLAIKGTILTELGKLDDSIEFLEKSVGWHPDDFLLNACLGRSLALKEIPEGAVPYYIVAIDKDPKDLVVHYQLGLTLFQIYLKNGKEPKYLNECLDVLNRGLELPAQDIFKHLDLYNLRALVYDHRRQPGDKEFRNADLAMVNRFSTRYLQITWLWNRYGNPGDKRFVEVLRSFDLRETISQLGSA